MAPRKRVVVALVLLLAVLVSGGQAQQAAAPAPAPLLIRGADDAGLGSLARGITHVVVGDGYIGCLEMRFSRCFADPTLACVEDAMVECSLEAAAAAAATTTGPAAPLAGGGAAAELVLGAIGGIIVRGIATAGAKYHTIEFGTDHGQASIQNVLPSHGLANLLAVPVVGPPSSIRQLLGPSRG